MPTFNNIRELEEYIKKNSNSVIGTNNEGKEIEYKCPACNKETRIIITKDGNGVCKECNNKIKIDWKLID